MSKNKLFQYIPLLGFIALCLFVGFLGSLATATSVKTWYPNIGKPFWTPPSWLFGPVWLILYIMMGIAIWRVWLQLKDRATPSSIPYYLFFLQLFLNLIWSFLFFGLRNPFLGMVDIWLLWAAIAATMIAFARIDRYAVLLMIPYILWVTYAGVLNCAVWVLNREPPLFSQPL